ncbi:tryptophan dimethylallyltransferase family protein [Saccharopolyspora rosea]|uniref:Tryptophan dimethylallyltransferase family protein n=1 Tax=Saccharopolyspora rosea TaxID=524884 RepID=A0ABW3G1J9_9PSEU|nr:tryptophan dimethylallyltransferase family protein [Saccharopolyspora rosea]
MTVPSGVRGASRGSGPADQRHDEFLAAMWHRVCAALGFGAAERAAVADRLGDLLGPWARQRLGSRPRYPSYVSHGGLPLEMSVNWSAGGTQVRVVWESLGEPEPTPGSCLDAGRACTRRLGDEPGMSLARYREVEHLFLGSEGTAAHRAQNPRTPVVWNALAWSPGRPPAFGVYLNPQVDGPGRAEPLVGEAMRVLGLEDAWRRVGPRYPELVEHGHEVQGFAMDLVDSRAARVKVYLVGYGASVADLGQVVALTDHPAGDRLLDACRRTLGHDGPCRGMPPATCLGFRTGHDRPTAATAYLPVPDGGLRSRHRIAEVMADNGLDPAGYLAVLAELTGPDHCPGAQKYVSYKADGDALAVSAYLKFDAYEADRADELPAVLNAKPAGRPVGPTTHS